MGLRQSLIKGLTAFSLGCASGSQGAEPSTVPPIGSQAGAGAAEDVETTLLLVGDAGWAAPDDPVLARVAAHASQRPDRTVVVFLGDNVYPDGMPVVGAEDRQRAEDILLAQLQVGRGGAQTIFVPGNHDWDDSGVGGGTRYSRRAGFWTPTGRCSCRPAGARAPAFWIPGRKFG